MKKIKDFIKKIPWLKNISYRVFNILRTRLSFYFFYDYIKFKKINDDRFKIKFKNIYPQLNDKTDETFFDPHYTYHPAWAARIIKKINPTKHIDISSILQFSTILSAFVPVEFYDYRPARVNLENLECKQADLNNLPFPNNSIESLSCMHTIEHIGLGRYGDQIDPKGDLQAIKELTRVLAINGNLLFVVPMGKPEIYFNAHRVYSYDMIIEYFKDLTLMEFSLIEKEGELIINATKDQADKELYGCGCFWFKK